ncbi:DUF2382 domain-containing protein [Lyngbya sp. PCC 8106]|uniref:DUF2382 domain-containing protein n=1 Tax=Lyngbya sp. (strain PCC 8106) TaxID=313612 RepID=UPI0000EACE3D|nr:DUF2382 domain-containing protein [Lyngbya sp. PCC 8106]EAW34754.1 hypothetical protein L8106_26067 [Lyngbya sp. PCC 8106]
METQNNYQTVSSPESLSTSQEIKTYSVVDEKRRLIGKIERILKNDSDQIQILFSLPGQSKPVFRVHQKSIIKADLENHQFVIRFTEKMQEKLNQYSASWNESLTEKDNIPSVDDSDYEDNHDSTNDEDESYHESVESETIRLLAERLEVKHDRHKIGEVVVRKQVETEIVEVPVRREKLIVEQVGSSDKPLAEIDLSQGKIEGVELKTRKSNSDKTTVQGEFISLKAAGDLLHTLAMEDAHGCTKVRVELVLNDPQYQQQYQELFDRCTQP